jgi:hypothetical protein
MTKAIRYFFCNNIISTETSQGGIYRQKVRLLKDRYDIHTLTNIDFMCSLTRSHKFDLRLNELIALLYRMTQVFAILNKNTRYYS